MIVKNDHSAPAGVAIILMTALCLLGMLIRYWWVDTQQSLENDLTQESLQATQTALAATQTALVPTQTALAEETQRETWRGVQQTLVTMVMLVLALAAGTALVFLMIQAGLSLRHNQARESDGPRPFDTARTVSAAQMTASAESTAETRPLVLRRKQPDRWILHPNGGAHTGQPKPLKLTAGETKTAALPRDRS